MAKNKYHVVIDTDPGLGKRAADVDDGLAIFLMLNLPEIFDIVGITTVYGNTPVEIGYKLVGNYLQLAERQEIPRFIGASSRYNLGKLTDASKFLIETIQEYENELILLALGPLTNIASVFHQFPSLIENVKKIIFMGGTIERTSAFSPPFIFEDGLSEEVEFNFQNDPIAAKTLLELDTSIPRIGMGLDICCKAVFKEEHLKKVQSIRNPINNYIFEHTKSWLKVWKFNKSEGFYPFDCFVPMYLLKPKLFNTVNLCLTVDTEKNPGKVIILDEKSHNCSPITFCTDFRSEHGNREFMDYLISNLIARNY